MLISDELSFEIIDLNSCRLLGIVDTSYYRDPANVEGKVLQIRIPNGNGLIELNYVQSGVTVINSNSLQLSSVADPQYLLDLPDGLYIGKISICPFEDNWAEKKWYRICQLKCKFYKAFLKSKIDGCSTCLNQDTLQHLHKAWEYIIGIEANVADCNFDSATRNYEVANNILNTLLECKCNEHLNGRASRQFFG